MPIPGPHKISLMVPNLSAVATMELALERFGGVVSSFIRPLENGRESWIIELYTDGAPRYDHVNEAVIEGALAAYIPAPDFILEPLPAIDWVAENQKSFQPIRAGRFYLHPSHDPAPPPPGAWPIMLDAGMAFGTGEHGTTLGCLLQIDSLALRRRAPKRILDLGCGTGVLAMASVLAWRGATVLGSDIDPDAVAVARANAGRNRLAGALRLVQADGLAAPALRRGGPYDLVIANMLARPLRALAQDIARVTAKDGRLILSGLRADQQTGVLAAYRRNGFRLETRHVIEGWATLCLRRGGRRRP